MTANKTADLMLEAIQRGDHKRALQLKDEFVGAAETCRAWNLRQRAIEKEMHKRGVRHFPDYRNSEFSFERR